MQRLVLRHTNRPELADYILQAERLGVSREEAAAHYADGFNEEVYHNNRYLVILRDAPPMFNPGGLPGIKWLSIRRLDGKVLREWGDLQRIKNQLLGKEAEAVEVFPAESRKVNAVNQYHLFGGADWKAPFGFPRRKE